MPTNIISRATLVAFWTRVPAAEAPLSAWYTAVRSVEWTRPDHLRSAFGSADFVADNRVIFDVGGNKYRVIAHFVYEYKSALIKFVGTHKKYDEYHADLVGNPNVSPAKQKKRRK